MTREERQYFYNQLKKMFDDWAAKTTDISNVQTDLTSFADKYMVSITGQQPLPQAIFRLFLEEYIPIFVAGGLGTKQDKYDEALQTASKHVVDAINELKAKTEMVDDQLSTTSTNPLTNKRVTEEFLATAQHVSDIEKDLSATITKNEATNKQNIAVINQDINGVRIEIADIVDASNKQDAKINEVNKSIENHIGEYETLQQLVSSLETQNDNQEKVITQLQSTNLELNQQVQSLKADNNALQSKIVEMEDLVYAGL